MARLKNALRKHEVQKYVPGAEPTEEGWLRLAKHISTIGVEPNETTEEEAWYDGDGTPEETVTSIARAYTPEGHYNSEDKAQELIAGLQYETGDDRKVWHRVTSADGKKQWTGRATVLDIVAGAGDASAYEEFSCTIRYDQKPDFEELTP